MHQLALDIQPAADLEFDSFRAGANGELVRQIQTSAAGTGEPYLFFWGAAATGKTHLLQAATRLASDSGRRAAYLPLGQRGVLAPAMLEGLEQLDLVCLDDLQAVAGDADWEEPLFHLFNRLRSQGCNLQVSADQPLAGLPVDLPDLRSRLAWGPCYQVHPLDDGESLQLLIDRAGRLGMELSPEAARYILYRCRRDAGHLMEAVQRLDRLTLERQRRPSIQLIRDLLEQDG